MWQLVYSVLDQPIIYGLVLNVAMIVVPLFGFGVKSVVMFFHKLSILLAWTFFIVCVVFVVNTAGLLPGWYVLAIIALATVVGSILGNLSANIFTGKDKI